MKKADTDIFNAFEKEIRPNEKIESLIYFDSEIFGKSIGTIYAIFSPVFDAIRRGVSFRMVINYDAEARNTSCCLFKNINKSVEDGKTQED